MCVGCLALAWSGCLGDTASSSSGSPQGQGEVNNQDPGDEPGGPGDDLPDPGDNNDPGPGDNNDPGDDETPIGFEAAEAVMPRLTADQYRNSLIDLFGAGLPATPVEPDTNPYLFRSIGAAQTVVSAQGVERYADAAFNVAQVVFAEERRRAAVLDCAPVTPDDACAESFVRQQGLRIMRRPLSDEEVERWLSVSRDVAEGDPLLGLETVLAGMLQSSHFLYRVELGEPDPEEAGARRYTSWEMAQRLSFLLWNTAPDQALLDAAERGELVDDVTLEAHAQRMLDDPRARRAVQDFFAQYLDLSRLARVERDPMRYPGASETLLAAMETELRLLVDDVVFRQDTDVRELFSAPRGYVNSELAALYGVTAPGASLVAFVPVEFPPESPRAGILTLGAFLTMNAHPTETSPTLRGKYLRERIFCQDVPPPPDDIDLNLEQEEGDAPTLRERLEQHRNDPACSGCHSFIDPPGYLFEHYDSIGRYREEAEGYPINAAGDLDGVPMADARDLAAVLRDDERVGDCMARQLYRHANGRLETFGERRALRDLQSSFAASGYRFRDLMLALALSEGFRKVSTATEEAQP